MEKEKEVLEINNLGELNTKLNDLVKNNSINKPSEEEVEAAKKEFEEVSINFEKKLWEIGSPEDALTYINYLKDFLKYRILWSKNGWMGVIKMMEELELSQKEIEENPGTSFKLGYQPLEFVFYAFQNPGGIGLESAKAFESENSLYMKIFDEIGSNLSKARDELKMIQFLQDRYIAMMQGYYLELEAPEQSPAEKSENEGSSEEQTEE